MKISPYRTGELRFGTRDPKEKVHGEVIEYTLSPEELEAYKQNPKREQIPMKRPFSLNLKPKEGKEVELTREMYMERKRQGKTDREIIKEFGLHSNLMQKLKNQWGLVKVSPAEYQKEVAAPHLAELEEKHKQLTDDFETLKGNYQELNQQYQDVLANHDRFKQKILLERSEDAQIETELRNEINDRIKEIDGLKKELALFQNTSRENTAPLYNTIEKLEQENRTLKEALKVVL